MRATYLALAACFAAAAAGADGQLANRCFDSDLGPWTPIDGTHQLAGEPAGPPLEPRIALFYSFPPRLLLADRPFERDDRWRRVEVPEGALPVPKHYRSWRLERDTLRIGLSDGFTGVRARLVAEASGWRGVLSTFSDQGGSQLYQRTIRLDEADCSSDPPVPASTDPRLPRAVPGGTGPALRLGRLLPTAYELEPDVRIGPGGWLRGFTPGGYWAGAERVAIRLGVDSLVSRIELRYPDGFDTRELAEGLTADFGPGWPDSPWPTWWNHSTRAFLQQGSLPRVVLIDTTLGR